MLIGSRGAGKTTVGTLLANELGFQQIDTDQLIEQKMNMTIHECFKQHGESYFRLVEKEVIAQLSGSNQAVISVGGGAVEDPANRAALRELGYIVWLTASPEELEHRIAQDPASPDTRPPLTQHGLQNEIREKPAFRSVLYAELAEVIIDTSSRQPTEIAQSIIRHIPIK